MHPHYNFPRQTATAPDGTSTAPSVSLQPTTALLVDPSLSTGVTAFLTAPLLGTTTHTLSSSTSDTPSQTPTSTPTPDTSANSSNKLPTATLIGIIVTIFVLLAFLLVVVMTIRHRRRMQKRRGGKSSQKTWAKLEENKGTVNVQMRTVTESKSSPPASDLPSPRLPAPPQQSTHPFSPSLPSEVAAQAYIPNPFTSPPHSPSPPHSRSPSNVTETTEPHTSSIRLSAFPAVQYANHLSVASSLPSNYRLSEQDSDSLYEHVFDSYREADTDSHTELIPQPQPQSQSQLQSQAQMKYSQYTTKSSHSDTTDNSRVRELKAMQDIISAIESTSGENGSSRTAISTTPSAWKGLTVDTESDKAISRLSMGEGLVTPGGHSVRSEDGSFFNDGSGTAEDEVDHFPLPPSGPFRTVLDDGRKQQSRNPFAG